MGKGRSSKSGPKTGGARSLKVGIAKDSRGEGKVKAGRRSRGFR